MLCIICDKLYNGFYKCIKCNGIICVKCSKEFDCNCFTNKYFKLFVSPCKNFKKTSTS